MNETSTAENKTQSLLERECLQHMAENGIPFNGPLKSNGEIQRFSIDGKRNQPDEWYSCHTGISKNGFQYLTCNYGTWSGGGRTFSYKSYDNNKTLSKEDWKQLKEEEEYRLKKLKEDQKKEILKKIERAKSNWGDSKESPSHDDHSAYLERKKVKPFGVRYSTNFEDPKSNVLVVPFRNIEGEIQSIQHIKADGTKTNHGPKKGNFHQIGEITNAKLIYVCEGYSTAATIHEAAEAPAIVAVDCGNLEPVIANLRTKYPKCQIIIAGDDDSETTGNPGRTKAKAAAKLHGCSVIFPEFPDDFRLPNGKRAKDFNDLHVHFGIDSVRNQLKKSNSQDLIAISSQPSTIQNEMKNLVHTLLEKENPCADFTTKDLPKQLCEYIDSICETTDAHPIMITTSVLSSISGIIKKKLFIPKGEYFQTLYTNLWLINLYKSGGFKSTAMENGADIARSMSKDVIRKIKEIETEIKTDKANKDVLEIKKLEASLKDVVLPNKITAEALLEHLSQGHAGVILTGEFGAWLQNLDKGHNGDLKGIFTELYDVPPAYRYKTKGQGDHILEDPYFSICGVSTLAWLKENLKPNDVSSGFFARFLLFTPPHQDKTPPALPRFAKPTNPEAEWYVRKTLENMEDEYAYKLAPSGRHVFESAHDSLYSITKAYSDKCQEILDPYLKRWSPYILKLAMIMRLFEDPQAKEISDTAINSAMAVLLPAIRSTAQLFQGELSESDQQKKCRLILEWICKRIQKEKAPTWAALITSNVLDGGAGMYEYPMKTLVEGGLVNEIQKAQKRDWLYMPVNKAVG
jgi:phage/plasmid primase-like uncharacterized protein